jgi:hypothetical protein
MLRSPERAGTDSPVQKPSTVSDSCLTLVLKTPVESAPLFEQLIPLFAISLTLLHVILQFLLSGKDSAERRGGFVNTITVINKDKNGQTRSWLQSITSTSTMAAKPSPIEPVFMTWMCRQVLKI